MRKSTALEFFDGSVSALAQAIGITKSAVSQWDDVVPEGSAYKLESLTGGKLRVVPELYKRPSGTGGEKAA